MQDYTSRVRFFIDTQFGRCAKCMRLVFWGSVLGWSGTALAYQFQVDQRVVLLVFLLSLSLTALTAAHILVFAWRHSLGIRRSGSEQVIKVGKHAALPMLKRNDPPVNMSRRRLFKTLLRNTAVAAVASVGLPKMAVAACGDCAATYGYGYYDCITYFCNNQGQTCCPPGYPYLNHCDCTCYDGTDFNCGSYSACQYCG